jgi:hypothetical protein
MRRLHRILSFTLAICLTAGLGLAYPGTHAQGATQNGVTFTKSVSPDRIHAGDQVTYTITISNDSPTTYDFDIEDPALGFSQNDVRINTGESRSYNLTANPTEDITNTAGALATAVGGDIFIPPFLLTDNATVDVLNPEVSVTKTVSPDTIMIGESVTYTINVTNSGDSWLTVDVTDDVLGNIASGIALDAGTVLTFEITDSPTADVINTVTVNGTDEIGGVVTASATAMVQVSSEGSLALIHGPDESATESFLDLLRGNGYAVQPVAVSEVAETDFSGFDLVVVTSDTGYDYSWGDSTGVEAIAGSGLPILGTGFGGASLFQQLGLSANWGNGWLGNETNLLVTQLEHPIFSGPNPVFLPGDGILTLYESSEHIGEYAPVLDAAASLLGREPGDESHYPLVQEAGNVLWGFTEGPDMMTGTGRSLFLNVIVYLIGLAEEGLPDLVITDVWSDNVAVWYQVMNVGEAVTPSGHLTELRVDGEPVSTDLVELPLNPGQRLSQAFDYEWLPTPPADSVAVVADSSSAVQEVDETNNRREETWAADTTAPVITSEPDVSDITQTSAVISWETDEAADGLVHFGSTSGTYDRQEYDPDRVTAHSVALRDLQPATTYGVVVESADQPGNTVSSGMIAFRTLPLPDASPPSLTILDSGVWHLDEPVGVDATDNEDVVKVEFYVDDELVYIDYSAPFGCFLDSRQYANGQHDLTTKAYDSAGNTYEQQQKTDVANLVDETVPTVSITAPGAEATVAGKTQVTATLSDDTGLLAATLRIDADWWGDWYAAKPNTTQAQATFNWDTTSLSNGQYRVAVEVCDDDIKYAVDYVDVYVNNTPPPPPPNLVVTRSVTRIQNYFKIDLHVKNTGGDAAANVRLRDVLQLFQPISADSTLAKYEASYKPELSSWRMDITSKVGIAGGQQKTYTYYAVPVMTYPAGLTAMIGGDSYGPSTRIWYDATTTIQNYYKDVDLLFLPYAGYPPALAVSDYLIVTSPINLLRLNSEEDVNDLLSTMAELAKLKNGVLGYLDVPATFPRTFDPHDGFTVGDVLGNAWDEVVIGDLTNGRIYIEGVPSQTQSYGPGATFRPPWRAFYNLKCGYLDQGYAAGDGLVVGQFIGLAKDQIILADASDDRFFVYDGDGWRQGNHYYAADQTDPFLHGDIEAYDGLAAGDVNGDGGDELVFADRSENKIRVFRVTGVYKNESFSISHKLLEIAQFSSNFEAHDGLAVGDVIGDGKAEIVLADHSADKVFVMSYGGNILGSFSVKFDEGYGLATGHVAYTWPNDKEEIIISDPTKGRVWVYRADGYLMTGFKQALSLWDGLAAGSVAGTSTDEVIVAGVSDDFLHFRDPWQAMGEEHVLANLIKAKQDTSLLATTTPVATGAWSKKLKSDWVTNGYMLIVGETDIVPAFKGEYLGSVLTTHGKWPLQADVTDYPYASTYGELIKPELALGRVVGNSADDLKDSLDISIGVAKGTAGYGFDRSFSLAVSGFAKGVSGGADNIDFKSEALKVALTMKNAGINGLVMFTPDYAVYKIDGTIDQPATEAAGAAKFFQYAPNNDIIFLAGHGAGSGWDVLSQDDVLKQADPFGDANPIVFASSCYTGEFTHAHSVANAFLVRGAAIYFGATKWGLGTHAGISPLVFSKWDPGEPFGLAVKQVKRSIGEVVISSSTGTYVYPKNKERYWSAIYHVLGDPKFGTEGPPSSTTTLQTQAALTVSPSIEVSVPGYEVLHIDGQDHVSIPGGSLLAMSGLAAVPYYQVSYEYPKSFQIEDVVLESRSAPETANNLNIPTVVESIGALDLQTALPEELQGIDWWPQKPFSWSVIDGVDSNTLVISLFPFAYNSLTQDARFYRDFRFNVVGETSTVEITELDTDRRVYHIGEDVDVGVHFGDGETGEIPPTGRTVVVSAYVYRSGTGEKVGGLPLRTLDGFRGMAAYSDAWSSTGQEPGLYSVKVEIRTPEGKLLAGRIQSFILGDTRGEITDLAASPTYYSPGEPVALGLDFANTGTATISGTAIMTLLDESGETVQVFEHSFTGLVPGDNRTFQSSWDSTGASGAHTVTATVEYGPYASGPLSIPLLPDTPMADAGADQVVERTSVAGATVTLNGSASSDPEDDPLTYQWTWVDGSASGVAPSVHLPPGLTTVTLTVSDSASADTDTVDIIVTDTTGPAVQIEVPQPGDAMQDSVTILASADDPSGVHAVYVYIRQPDDADGIPQGYETLPAVLTSGSTVSGEWGYEFDTTVLNDGVYVLLARAVDYLSNQAWTETTLLTIRNWASTDLLPASGVNRAGRTMPVKFTVRVRPEVDVAEPFVYNEQLVVSVFGAADPDTPLQVSTFGNGSTHYRIDLADEMYITNFKTDKEPQTYIVQVRRASTDYLIGEFSFSTQR